MNDERSFLNGGALFLVMHAKESSGRGFFCLVVRGRFFAKRVSEEWNYNRN